MRSRDITRNAVRARLAAQAATRTVVVVADGGRFDVDDCAASGSLRPAPCRQHSGRIGCARVRGDGCRVATAVRFRINVLRALERKGMHELVAALLDDAKVPGHDVI